MPELTYVKLQHERISTTQSRGWPEQLVQTALLAVSNTSSNHLVSKPSDFAPSLADLDEDRPF